MSRKGNHLCEINIWIVSIMKEKEQNNERFVLNGLYMDCAIPFKIEYELLSHSMFVQLFLGNNILKVDST